MRILHTADWHLGQTFYEYDRRAEHRHFLEWLKRQIKQRNIDLLLIAGDVFDGPNPSAEAQHMYYAFLREVTTDNPSLQIVIIAGNHDSAARLEAPSPLFDGMNITVRGVVKRDIDGEIDWTHLIVPIYKKEALPLINRTKASGGSEEELLSVTMNRHHIAAFCLAVPYLRQGDYPPAENYAAGVQLLYEQLYAQLADETRPVIAMGHLQAAGATLSEDDRAERSVVGGLEGVSAEAFSEHIAYTALGHLHRLQKVAGRDNIRYAGAPVPMSFAEAGNRSGVVMVEMEEGRTRIHRIEVPVYAVLKRIPATPEPLEAVLEALEDLPEGEVTERSPYLEVRVKMTVPDTSYKYKIELALQGKAARLARLVAVMPEVKASGIRAASYEELQSLHPLEVALDYYKRRYDGQDMADEVKQLLEGVIKEVEE